VRAPALLFYYTKQSYSGKGLRLVQPWAERDCQKMLAVHPDAYYN